MKSLKTSQERMEAPKYVKNKENSKEVVDNRRTSQKNQQSDRMWMNSHTIIQNRCKSINSACKLQFA